MKVKELKMFLENLPDDMPIGAPNIHSGEAEDAHAFVDGSEPGVDEYVLIVGDNSKEVPG